MQSAASQQIAAMSMSASLQAGDAPEAAQQLILSDVLQPPVEGCYWKMPYSLGPEMFMGSFGAPPGLGQPDELQHGSAQSLPCLLQGSTCTVSSASTSEPEDWKQDNRPMPAMHQFLLQLKIQQQMEQKMGQVRFEEDDTLMTEDDKEVVLMLRLEGAMSSEEILRIAHQSLKQMSTGTAISALHLAARFASTYSGCRPLAESPELAALVNNLRNRLKGIRQGRMLARLAWSLGKLEVRSKDVETVILHICKSGSMISKCTEQDLANTLWGLARLYPNAEDGSKPGPHSADVSKFASYLISMCSARISSMSAQCLSNTMWAMARLHIKGANVEEFVSLSLDEFRGRRDLRAFTPQGLSNIVWALAELHAAGLGSEAALLDVTEDFARESLAHLGDFQTQELSMLAWAMAKLHGRKGNGGNNSWGGPRQPAQRKANQPGHTNPVDALLVALAGEAGSRIHQLSQQSISNIAWALATRELLDITIPTHSQSRSFMFAAMEVSAGQLSSYVPQAVANILWASVRLLPRRNSTRGRQGRQTYAGCGAGATARAATQEKVNMFAVACARETTLRMLQFTWRDLASVSVALESSHCTAFEVINFQTLLCSYVASHCKEMPAQAMFNIAQAAVRSSVNPEAIRPMADAIEFTIAQRRMKLNDVDVRQWQEVRQWCSSAEPAVPGLQGCSSDGCAVVVPDAAVGSAAAAAVLDVTTMVVDRPRGGHGRNKIAALECPSARCT